MPNCFSDLQCLILDLLLRPRLDILDCPVVRRIGLFLPSVENSAQCCPHHHLHGARLQSKFSYLGMIILLSGMVQQMAVWLVHLC